jgi:hypothetical protein
MAADGPAQPSNRHPSEDLLTMKPQSHLAILSLLSACALAATAQAGALVVDGGEPDQLSAFLADSSHDFAVAATRFTLADAVTVNHLEWWGIYFPTGAVAVTDDFTLAIYPDAGGLPGAALTSVHLGNVQREATGQTVVLWPEYAYTALFPAIILAAGDYFLGLGNDPAGTELWGWETTAGGLQAGGVSYHSASGTWQEDAAENLAFRLSVPAPGSLALLAIGGAGLVRNRRRAQSARSA